MAEKVVFIGDSDKNLKTVYDAKGKTGICIPDEWNDFKTNAFKGVRAAGSTLYVTIHMCVGVVNDQEKWEDVELTIKNYTSIKNVYFLKRHFGKDETPVFPTDYVTNEDYYDYIISKLPKIETPDTENGTIVTGTAFADTIDMKNYKDSDNKGVIIKALAGNDTITGSDGADTIYGGDGDNTINYSNGNDIIVLSKGEKLKIDLSELSLDEDDLLFTTNKNGDLIFNIEDKDNLTVSKFVKSSAANKLEFTLDGTNYSDLENVMISKNDIDINESKKTATIKGTRLADDIKIDGDDIETTSETLSGQDLSITINAGDGDNKIKLSNALNKNIITAGAGVDEITLENTSSIEKNSKNITTVKAGSGKNDITVKGTGNNSIITGEKDDTFTFNEGGSTTKVKAGAGENTIIIANDKFGDVTILEEKVKAKNKIVINNIADNEDGIYKYSLRKDNNDLIIENTTSTLNLNSFFASGKKIAEKTINGFTLPELMENTGLKLSVIGEGTIKGSDYNDNIFTNDSMSDKEKNDKIYAGKGNDIINAGLGRNSIYVYADDGIETIENGGGVDTLIFKKGTSINFDYEKTDNQDDYGNDIYNLKIKYSNKEDDYVLIKNALVEKMGSFYLIDEATSVEALKIGSKTYTLKSYFGRNKIENMTDGNKVVGTDKDDDIYLTDTTVFKENEEVTVNGAKGSDNILIGSNKLDDDAPNEQHIIDNTNNYNFNPEEYNFVDIKPVVYTSTSDGIQDKTKNVFDKVVSYATNDGEYWAQSTISDIKVYGWKTENDKKIGTDDAYHAYYNKQFTKIADEAGSDDVLYIKDMTHNELKLLFNLSKNYQDWTEASANIDEITDENKDEVMGLITNSFQELKIVTSLDRNKFFKNPDKNSDIGIDIDYWGNKGLDFDLNEIEYEKKTGKLVKLDMDTLKSFGSGIEKIVASDGWFITSEQIAEVASNVAEWLEEKGFNFVEDVLDSKNAKANIADLIKIYDNIEWQNSNPVVD